MPIAGSTISLLMLSFDRYATVRHPRPGQLNQRRLLPFFLTFVTWIGAIVVCIPVWFTFEIDQIQVPLHNITNHNKKCLPVSALPSSNSLNITQSIQLNICSAYYKSNETQIIFILWYCTLVFIVPGIGVLLSYLGVRQKLCALSLTARAAHGELPLPMPLLRRPTNMIIVTGLANANKLNHPDSSEDELSQNRRGFKNIKQLSHGSKYYPRRDKESHENIEKSSSDLPLPQTSTLRSRRRLANILVVSAFVFIGCWTPHLVCYVMQELLFDTSFCHKSHTEFFLLLGYAHSAVSPVIYWILNHSPVAKTCCSSCIRISSNKKILKPRFR